MFQEPAGALLAKAEALSRTKVFFLLAVQG
jgi:hypothetical protein